MELKDRKALINTGELSPQEQPLLEKMNPVGALLGSTTGLSTLADRKAIHNLPKFKDGLISYNSSGVTVNGLNADNSGSSGPGFFKSVGNAINNAAGAVKDFANKDNKLFGTNANAMLSAGIGAVDFAGSIVDATKYNTTANDLLQDAGTSEGNIGGISYNRQNDVNALQVAAQEHAENKANTIGLMGKGASLGASIGSVAGPVGGLIGGAVGAVGGLVGGLFGSGRRHAAMRRRIAEAKDKAFRQNTFSRSGALTSALQQQYAREYGDTEQQSLYGFKDGKLVQSPFGALSSKFKNAYGANGELMIQKGPNGEVLSDQRLGVGMDNKDTVPIYVNNNTEILSNKFGELPNGIKVRPSEYYRQTGDLQGAEYANTNVYMKNKFKNGKLPGFALGLPEWANAVGNVLPMINALVDKHNILNEPISNPNTRKTNPYANVALKTMADMRYNNYQAYNDLWDTAYKHTHAVNNNGNLSAAQRAVMNYAGYKDAMDSMAKINQYGQEMNNKYSQMYAQMAAQLGDEQAKRDQQSAQFDYNAYNQAHGARRLMASQRRADAMNYLNNWAKGVIDMHNWRKMYNLYEDDVKNRKNNNTNNTSSKTPKVQLDPNGLFGKTNFAGVKSYALNPYAGTVEAGRPLPLFTAATPQDMYRLTNNQLMLPSTGLPLYWSSPKSYMNTGKLRRK